MHHLKGLSVSYISLHLFALAYREFLSYGEKNERESESNLNQELANQNQICKSVLSDAQPFSIHLLCHAVPCMFVGFVLYIFKTLTAVYYYADQSDV